MPEVTDGLSNTLMIGEDVPEYSAWCGWLFQPRGRHLRNSAERESQKGIRGCPDLELGKHLLLPAAATPAACRFAIADGSVRFIRDNITLAMYRAASTTQGGETVNLD